MSEGNWLVLNRRILDWEWYRNVNTKTLFIHCLLKANYTEKTWRGMTIKRGEFISSFNNLALETGLSIQNVRTSLKNLQLTHDVTHKGRTQHTVFTVVNYNKYQDLTREPTPQLTPQLTTTNNITIKQTNNKDTKGVKTPLDITSGELFENETGTVITEIKSNQSLSIQPSLDPVLEQFEVLWKTIPKELCPSGNKGPKERAKIEYRKLKPDTIMSERILAGAKLQIKDKRNRMAANEFCSSFKQIFMWIKEKRFADEFELFQSTTTTEAFYQ